MFTKLIGEIITLNINQIKKIKNLHEQGFSIREIAKITRKDKNTVIKYINYNEYQNKHPIIPRLTKHDARSIPINPFSNGENLSTNYPPVYNQPENNKRNLNSTTCQDVSSNDFYKKQDEQYYKAQHQDPD